MEPVCQNPRYSLIVDPDSDEPFTYYIPDELDTITFGRSRNCDIRSNNMKISGLHFTISVSRNSTSTAITRECEFHIRNNSPNRILIIPYNDSTEVGSPTNCILNPSAVTKLYPGDYIHPRPNVKIQLVDDHCQVFNTTPSIHIVLLFSPHVISISEPILRLFLYISVI